jgi:transposase
VCTLGMEACGGAHYWARAFEALGHTVKLMAPQYVKPYVKTNKNDWRDAAAICEAVGRESMSFVPIKSVAQQDGMSVHRIRERLIKQRTALMNEMRGLLLEYGIAIPQGISRLRRAAVSLIEPQDERLSALMKRMVAQLYEELQALEERLKAYDAEIKRLYQADERCQRLATIPGVGMITATAIVARIGSAEAFNNGRHLAASLGLVPRQNSTGGKQKMGSISKRGDRYVRKLLVHGARSALVAAMRKHERTRQTQWALALLKRGDVNKAVVALAHKMARMAWALLKKKTVYCPQPAL